METYDAMIKELIEDVSSADLPISEVPCWNQLSANDYDDEFTDKFCIEEKWNHWE